jgi:outer membrane protein with beta-barrel domain
MRKLIGVALFLCLVSLMAAAQESGSSKAEIFGGYQYTKFDGGLNANGFNGAVTGNLNRWLGVTADFSGAYGSQGGVDTKTYTYTFGPQVQMSSGKITPFAHALFGGAHTSASTNVTGTTVSASTSGFAFMLGGGVDAKMGRSMAFRLIQFDWLSLHANGVSDNNNMRISTGLVLHF